MVKIIYYLSLNAYHEARGESDEGIKAVTKVVLNRSRKRQKPIKDIIYAPSQFSWTADDIPDHEIEETQYKRCRKLVEEAIEEYLNGDTLKGSDHYHATSVTPYWAAHFQKITQIGNHIFYRE